MPPINESELEKLGKLQFTAAEVCLILDIDRDQFEKHRRAYDKGRLLAAALVRNSILELAEAGNTTAQKQMLELIDAAAIDNEEEDD
jgi:hypothetical protein